MSNLYKENATSNSVTNKNASLCTSTPVEISQNICNCPINNDINFCYTCIIDHCMCFVPAVDLKNAQVFYAINPNDIEIQLVSCGTMSICGLLQETVYIPNSSDESQKSVTYESYTKNTPFKCIIRDKDITDLDAKHWSVVGVDLIKSSYCPTCSINKSKSNKYYKLREQNAIIIKLTNSSLSKPSSNVSSNA